MKIQRKSFIMMLLLILFSGCNEITVTTKVNKDGSFTRFITVKGEKTSIDKQSLPYPTDSTWTKTLMPDSTDTTKFVLVYTKNFKNSKALNREIGADTSWFKHLKRQVEIRKGFGFFFSYLTFKETYHAPEIFNRLNYKDFLSQEDILFFSGKKIPVTRDDSIKFEKASEHVEDFFAEEFAAEIIAILQDGIGRVNDSSLRAEQVVQFKDTIKESVGDYLFKSKSYTGLLKTLTGNPAFIKLDSLQPPLFEEFNHKANLFLAMILMQEFAQTVEMPGVITATNSTHISGNKVSWEISSNRFYFSDYEMVAESRVVNTWAFLVTGLIVFGLLFLILIKAWK